MAGNTSYGRDLRGLESLVGALNQNGHHVPGHETLKGALAASLEEARVLKEQQESLQGNALAATDRFLDKVDEAEDVARKLRSFIISVLGPRSNLLPLFGIPQKPVPNPNSRRRRRKKEETPTQTPPNPQTPEGPSTKPPETAKPAA
jgi:hypothetical protein